MVFILLLLFFDISVNKEYPNSKLHDIFRILVYEENEHRVYGKMFLIYINCFNFNKVNVK